MIIPGKRQREYRPEEKPTKAFIREVITGQSVIKLTPEQIQKKITQPWKDEFNQAWNMITPQDKSDFFKDILYLQRFWYSKILSVGKEYQIWLQDR